MGKSEYLGGKPISQMQWKPCISLDEGFTAIEAQENKTTKATKQQKEEGGGGLHMRTYTIRQSHMHILL